jgi:hypothetical protein
MEANAILPDLQSAVLCEDVRCEFNGMHTRARVCILRACQLR